MNNKQLAPRGSNFYYAFLFLPPAKRAALLSVYAFCREVDDIVDECSDQTVAKQKLAWWQTEVERIYTGEAQHPIAKALIPIVAEYNLSKVWLDEILQGMTMDLQYQGYQTIEDLNVYCHCVASTVGMLSASIFGYKHAGTLEYAKKLGLAFQLINIIRDIGEDARRGRIYLPEEDLAAFDISPREILSLELSKPSKFPELLQKYANLAREYYTAALNLLAPDDRAAQRSGLIMAQIYFCILDEIEQSNFAVLNQKITITPLRKLWIAWRTMQREKKYA